MKILVCGGRDYRDRDFVFHTLGSVHAAVVVSCVVHGNASGADSLADEWATSEGIEVRAYPANWTLHGRKAGPIRNSQMLAEEPDIELVVAFPGGAGTADMVAKAKKKGIDTMVHKIAGGQ